MGDAETSTASTEPILQYDASNDTIAYSSTRDTTAPRDSVSGFSLDPNEAPPPYSAEPNWKLTYVDFTPKCTNAGGILSSPTFQTFE